jgi:hypothetical protein
MESFTFSENTDEYKTLVWKQFYHSERERLFGERNKLKNIFFFVLPILFFLAYLGNGKESNLILTCFFSLGPLFQALIHFSKRSLLQKEIANFPNNIPYTITLTEDGIVYITTNSRVEIKWDYFFDFEEFEGNCTLYKDKLRREMTYLPLSLASDNESLINLVRRKVKYRQD